MIEDAKFLIKYGAILSVYDMRSEARLKSHLIYLRSVGLANYVCGGIPADDLLDMDMVLLSNEYTRDSTFLNRVREKKIPIEYPETLFFKLTPPITLVGIIGIYGKTTVMSMLLPMIEAICNNPRQKVKIKNEKKEDIDMEESNFHNNENQHCFSIDSESGLGILVHLKKIRSGDIVVMKIDTDMMHELHSMRISPQVSIFTSIPHRSSYNDLPFEILDYQTYNNFIIASDQIIDAMRINKSHSKAKMLRTKASSIPEIWGFQNHNHNKDNASLALQAARLFKVSDDIAEDILRSWKPIKGRLELVKKLKGIEYYNDTASVSPLSTITGIMSLTEKKDLILIIGGVETGHDYAELCVAISKYVHTLVFLPGSGTMKERGTMKEIENVKIIQAHSIEDAVRLSSENANLGDKVLFSPAFFAGGLDISRKERGEKFVRAVRGM